VAPSLPARASLDSDRVTPPDRVFSSTVRASIDSDQIAQPDRGFASSVYTHLLERASIDSDRVTPPDRVLSSLVHNHFSTDRPLARSDLVKHTHDMANLPPVIHFGYSEASQCLEASFENNIVLTNSVGMGRNRIEAALHHQMPQYTWIARYYDDSRYLIEAPNPR
jgi:hypothetical protein